MKFIALAAVGAALLVATPSFAAETAGKAKPLIPAESFAPDALLPAPPADGSPVQKAELRELIRIEKTRTKAEYVAAKWDEDHENASAFDGVMGVDLATLPDTAKLLAAVKVEDKAAGKLAKNYFQRNRPWIVDPALKSCSREDKPKSSYPSGHTTIGFSLAVVLAHLVPEKAPAIMARAEQYGYHRMVCSMHYRSDVVAGEALGTTVAYALLQDAEFKAQFALAHAELVKAGVAK